MFINWDEGLGLGLGCPIPSRILNGPAKGCLIMALNWTGLCQIKSGSGLSMILNVMSTQHVRCRNLFSERTNPIISLDGKLLCWLHKCTFYQHLAQPNIKLVYLFREIKKWNLSCWFAKYPLWLDLSHSNSLFNIEEKNREETWRLLKAIKQMAHLYCLVDPILEDQKHQKLQNK